MGIVNATDDSFFQGSRATGTQAVQRGLAMWEAGATWVDVGGESTRPGAEPVSVEAEKHRVVPVIEDLRAQRPEGLISIDTRHAEVALAALEAGADMVNDVSGLREPAMVDLVLRTGCAVCIMHMQGEPGSMQTNPQYDDVVSEVGDMLETVKQNLIHQGHPEELICVDPGIGFGKTQNHNIALLKSGRQLLSSETSLLWGVSRKSVVGHLTGHTDPADRLAGTLGLAAVAHRMRIDLVRVHDVQEHVDVFAALKIDSA
tara:strand:+ start:5682 stop:6458 length:777 start_codon:yes stop_codon:yes gene_type:complete